MPPTYPLAALQQGAALRLQLASTLAQVFRDPGNIARIFTEDYVQTTDGKRLDRAEFEAHVRHVAASVRSIRFEVVDAAQQADTLADRHIVEIAFTDGREARLEVYLFARLRDGRIAETHEVTRVMAGDDRAQELASALE